MESGCFRELIMACCADITYHLYSFKELHDYGFPELDCCYIALGNYKAQYSVDCEFVCVELPGSIKSWKLRVSLREYKCEGDL